MDATNLSRQEKLIDGRPAERCSICKGLFSWAKVDDGVCADCWCKRLQDEADGRDVLADPREVG